MVRVEAEGMRCNGGRGVGGGALRGGRVRSGRWRGLGRLGRDRRGRSRGAGFAGEFGLAKGMGRGRGDAGKGARSEGGETEEKVCRAAGVGTLLLAEDGRFCGGDGVGRRFGLGGLRSGLFVEALERVGEGQDGVVELELCGETDAECRGELGIGDVEERLGGSEIEAEGVEGGVVALGDLGEGEGGTGEVLDEAGEVGGVEGAEGHGSNVRVMIGIVNRILYGSAQVAASETVTARLGLAARTRASRFRTTPNRRVGR